MTRVDTVTKRIIGKYSADAAEYEAARRDSPKWAGEHEVVAAALEQLPPNSRVLDAAIGTGRFIDLYDHLGIQFVGVDLCAEMLEEAAAKSPGADLRLEDCRTLHSCADSSFDAVMCIRLLNLLTKDDCCVTLRTFARVVRPGGLVVVSLKTLPDAPDDKPRTLQDETVMLEAMQECELEVVSRVEVPSTGRGRYDVFVLRRQGGAQ